MMAAVPSSLSPLKLAVVTETWPPEINGVANTLVQLVQGLQQRGDYAIQLIRPRQSALETPLRQPAFNEYLTRGLRLPFYREVRLGMPQWLTLKRLWQQDRPDIVQIVTEGPLGYAALRAAQQLKIPMISDFHTRFDQYSQYYRVGLLLHWAERYLRYLHNQTAVTLVPTRELQEHLQQQGYRRLAILSRGIDTQLFNPQRRCSTLRASLGIAPDQLLVVLVSRLAHEKNLDLAFQAFTAIQAQQPEAKFLVVGDGPERKRLQAQYPDVLFAGMQTGNALAEHYASGDLFLYPSLSETFGNVIVEAMACGLPVVAFDYAAAREYIRLGKNGWVVPFQDQAAFMQMALNAVQDKHLRQSLGQAAWQTARQLDWKQVVNGLDEILKSTIQAHHNHATHTVTMSLSDRFRV